MKCKTQKLIARGRDLSEPLAKISVPQERGGLAKLHCSQRDHETLHLAGLRRGLPRYGRFARALKNNQLTCGKTKGI
jgi:hypothetical protein